MPVATEQEQVNNILMTSREPKVKAQGGDKGSVGDQALMDAVLILAAAWLLLVLLGFSVRGSNV